jgi:hypothetical protein
MEKPQDGATKPQGPGPTEKHLGRGLEDVSHLFLSQAAPVAGPSKGEANRSLDIHGLPADRATPAVSQPSGEVDQKELVSVLYKSAGVLEQGLRAIDTGIACEIGGAIDLVAVDRCNQLVLIDVDASGSDALLLRGICHVDWVARNVPIVRRMYSAHTIDFGSEPRLFLIGPRFSPVVRCALQRITSLRITCVTYNLVTLPNGIGVFFQHP